MIGPVGEQPIIWNHYVHVFPYMIVLNIWWKEAGLESCRCLIYQSDISLNTFTPKVAGPMDHLAPTKKEKFIPVWFYSF